MKKEEVEQLAALSRIELRDGEAEALTSDITAILEYVSAINEITGGEEGEKIVGELHNVMREDADPHESGKYTEALLDAAPKRKGQYVEVKKILDGGS